MSIPGAASPLFIGAAAGAAAAYQIDRSLRFNKADTAYLNRTPSSTGNRKTWTWSGWVKDAHSDSDHHLWVGDKDSSESLSNSTFGRFYIESNGAIRFSGYTTPYRASNALLRDPAAWYHLVVALDTTQSTADDRIKIYVNGVQLTDFSIKNNPDQNDDLGWNTTTPHTIGARSRSGTIAHYHDGLLAEIHFVDGTALAASAFGEYDNNNVWQPKDCKNDLTYGTNGFYLKFDDNSSAAALGNDSSGNDNDFTVNNLTAENPTTLPGVDFDGTNDHVESADHADYSLGTNDFTIEFYVYPREFVNYDALVMKYAGSASNSSWWMSTNSSGHILFYLYYGSSEMGIITSGTGMTLNKWNHVACVRDGSTARVYINGVQVGTGTISTNSVNDSSTALRIGEDSQGYYDFDGVMSNVRLVNGTCLYPSGTTFTVPSTPLTNVTNTKLLCCQSSSSATAATVSPNTLTTSGDPFATQRSDSSSANDSLIDTPTNYSVDSGNAGGNYATMNPLDKGSSFILEDGNLKCPTHTGSAWNLCRATQRMDSGKFYWEITIDSINANLDIGVADGKASGLFAGGDYAYRLGYAAPTAGDVWGLAYDADGGKLDFYLNGALQSIHSQTSVPSKLFPAISLYGTYQSVGSAATFNFGQRPFAYTPPTGYVSLCTTNLPDPTIADGSTAFNAVAYSGNGGTQSITGVNFSPDFLWFKRRQSPTRLHMLYDTVRGASGDKVLKSDSTGDESWDTSTYGQLDSADSNGFTVTDGSNTDDNINSNNDSYIAWLWDAGTSTVSNTDGDITSSVRANQTAGFSIVAYTGNSTAGATIGHGLNAQPGLVIIKNRDRSVNWVVGHLEGDSFKTGRIYLNTTGAQGTDEDFFYDTNPTSSVFTVKDNYEVNYASEDYLALVWAPVEGYSAFGTYTGTGTSTDAAPFVYTGFRPAWVMVKLTSEAGENWLIKDSTRDVDNPATQNLYANLNAAESTTSARYIDFLSNGFQLRGDGTGVNGSGKTYIYAAFAEHSFSLNGGLAR